MLIINTLLFKILEAVPNPNLRMFSMIQKLQNIINRSKEDAIILTYGDRQEFHYPCSILPPYGVAVFTAESVERGEWDDSSSIQTFYSDILLLLSEGVSAKCHSSILKYHLFVLVSRINLLINGWCVSLYILCYDLSVNSTGPLQAGASLLTSLTVTLTGSSTLYSGSTTYWAQTPARRSTIKFLLFTIFSLAYHVCQ